MRIGILASIVASFLAEYHITDAYSVVWQQKYGALVPTVTTTTISRWALHQYRKGTARFVVSSNVEDTTATPKTGSTTEYSFIQTELRGAAMKLHTRQQSPKEGGVDVKATTTPKEPYRTTHDNYLSFLVDSQHVYQAMEDIVNQYTELLPFRNTGLERVLPLENDIQFMIEEYALVRPLVNTPGREYAELLHQVAATSIPAFVCHYYNHYFAHTAGGRMIGKQMSALLLDKKTLEFYKVRVQPFTLPFLFIAIQSYRSFELL
jgi:Heme oxygenase